MNITAPFDTVKEVKPLIEAGADELYCGVFSPYWNKRRLIPNSRISVGNLSNFRELREALKIAKNYNIPVFLCTNEYLGKGALAYLQKDIISAIELGVSGFILAEPDLIHFIRQLDRNSKIILSCLNPCFNSEALEFFSELGVHRVVLDRQLTLNEIKSLSIDAKQANIELEIFIHNIVCRFVNGNCLFHKLMPDMLYRFYSPWKQLEQGFRNLIRQMCHFHRKKIIKLILSSSLKLQPCRREYRLEVLKAKEKGFIREKILEPFYLDREICRYCAVCSMYFLEKFGIVGAKIIGRGFLTQKKIKDVKFVRRYLDELHTGSVTENNFLSRGSSLYREIYGKDCSYKQCHHWEVYQLRQKLDLAR